jgi:hypothetical protein
VLGVTGGRASACPHGPAAGARKAAAARSQAPRDSGGETQGSDRVRARTTSAASYSVPLQVPMHQAWLDRATLPAATVDRQGHGTRPRMLPVHMRASDGHPQRLPDRVLPSAGLRPRRTVLMPHGMRSRYTARFATDRLFGLQGSPPRLIVAPRARRSEIVDCARLARSVLGVAERMVLLVSPRDRQGTGPGRHPRRPVGGSSRSPIPERRSRGSPSAAATVPSSTVGRRSAGATRRFPTSG